MTLAIFPCSFAAKTSIDIISGSPDGQSTGFRCEPYMVLCELQVRSAAHTEYGFSAFPQAGQGDVVLGTETGIILVECFDIEGTGILGKREDNVLQQKCGIQIALYSFAIRHVVPSLAQCFFLVGLRDVIKATGA